MAKFKQVRQKNRRVKTFIAEDGSIFRGTYANKKVTVRVERTARGQQTLAGVYNFNEQKWEQTQGVLPKAAKEFFQHPNGD